jgi:hypothetical protein
MEAAIWLAKPSDDAASAAADAVAAQRPANPHSSFK